MIRILILKDIYYAEENDNGTTFVIKNVVNDTNIVRLTSKEADFFKLVYMLNNGFDHKEEFYLHNDLIKILNKMCSRKDLFFDEVNGSSLKKKRILKNQLINVNNLANIEKVDFQKYISKYNDLKIYIKDNDELGDELFTKFSNDGFNISKLKREEIDKDAIILLNLRYKDELLDKVGEIDNKIICYYFEKDKLNIGPIIIKGSTGCLKCRQYEEIKGINSEAAKYSWCVGYNIDLAYYFLIRNMLYIIGDINRYIVNDVGLVINKQVEVDLNTSRALAKVFINDPNCG